MNTPIDISEESGVRYLHFGSDWVQGAMRLRKPDALELEYTREMMAGLLLRPAPWPARVLLIGLGAGSLAKFVHRQLPDACTTVVEIAPEVHGVARQYFRLPDEDERLRVVIGDGAGFVEQDDSQWDLIAVDGFDSNARAGALAGQAFYAACRRRLTADGLLVVNMFGELRGFKTQLQRLNKAFDGRVLALPPAPAATWWPLRRRVRWSRCPPSCSTSAPPPSRPAPSSSGPASSGSKIWSAGRGRAALLSVPRARLRPARSPWGKGNLGRPGVFLRASQGHAGLGVDGETSACFSRVCGALCARLQGAVARLSRQHKEDVSEGVSGGSIFSIGISKASCHDWCVWKDSGWRPRQLLGKRPAPGPDSRGEPVMSGPDKADYPKDPYLICKDSTVLSCGRMPKVVDVKCEHVGACIVVHGVNDVGTAYPAVEEGLMAGLAERMKWLPGTPPTPPPLPPAR
jgi:spermidine synthase